MTADKDECSIFILVNLTAAFDMVDQTILINRLQNVIWDYPVGPYDFWNAENEDRIVESSH